jgi:predicted GNAT family N-acyltransferase
MILAVEFATPEYDELVRLRYEVLREPLGLEYRPEDLSKEHADVHLALYDNDFRLLGCLLLRSPEELPRTAVMKQVAVRPELQGRGLGKRLVAAFEQRAREMGRTEVVLHARATAVPFYEKIGYRSFDDPFEEVGLPHRKMRKDL